MAVLTRAQSTVYGLETDLDTIRNSILVETNARIAGDDNLLALINAETTARTDALSTLTTNLNNEIARAEAAEGVLQDNIDAEEAARISSVSALSTELTATQHGAGLTVEGFYSPDSGSNYLITATSLKDADNKLDAQVKVNANNISAEASVRGAADASLQTSLNAEVTRATGVEAGLQTELDATQSGAGLDTDGAYSADAGSNYLAAATSLKDADVKLDAAVKSNEDGVAALDAATVKKAANLSDLTDVSAARGNLDVMSVSEVQSAINDAELGLGSNISVADIAARDALGAGELSVGDNVFVTDDGDTHWAIYKVTETTDGSGANSTFTKIMDQDLFLNAQDAAAIKASYESNADTNEFNDEEKLRVGRVGDSSVVLGTTAQDIMGSVNELHSEHDGLQVEVDATQSGAGLGTDGSYSADAGSNYLTAATSLKDADVKLDAQAKVNADAIVAEATRATAAETTLQANIDAEEATRVAADGILQGNIDAEEAARIVAVTTLQANIDAEEAARVAADSTLQGNIDAEEAARIAADALKMDKSANLGDVADAAASRTNLDVYSKSETDSAISIGGAIFNTQSITVASDRIVLEHAPKNDLVLNFATVRHVDANYISYDIPVSKDGADASGKTWILSPNASGDFDGKDVTIQYPYTPE